MPNPNIYVIPDTLDFGTVLIGDTVYHDFTISNIGVYDLEIDEVEFALGDGSPFFTDFGEATVEGGSSILGSIGYLYPDQRVAIEDIFYIYSNDPDESVYELPIIVATIINQPPVITSLDSVPAYEDNYFKYTATATDPEDSTIIFFFDDLPSWLTANADSVYGTPSDADNDTSFLLIASDGELQDSIVVFIDIIHVNDPPNAFVLIYPVDSSQVYTTLPTLIWQAATDPDQLDTVRYMVQFGGTILDLETFYTDTMTSYQFTEDLDDNTDYFWRVIAEDLNGASTENSGGYQTFRVNTENDNPEGLVLLNPVNEALITELPLVVVWTPVTDLDGDSIWYDVHLIMSREIVGTTMNNYFIIDSLVEDQEYYIMVTANDNNGGYIESAEHVFNVNLENTPPGPFELVTPEAGEVLTSTTVTFDWEHASDPDPFDIPTYFIYVESDTLSWDYEVTPTLSEETILTPEESFYDNRIYHWSVTADDMNGGVTENIGGPSMFVINVENDAPAVASLVAPLDGSIQTDLTPDFYWTEADDPDPMDHISYTMHWWPMGVLPVIYSADTDSNSFTPEENLTDNSQFGWMVTANDIHGAESNSDSSYFYTDSIPEPPMNFATVSPENEVEGIATEVEFIWNQTYDPDPLDEIHYQLVYATDWEDSSTYVFSELIQDTSITLELEDNAQYYWMVIALDTDDFIVGSNDNTPNTMVVGTLSIDGADIPEVFALPVSYTHLTLPTILLV